MTSTQEPVGIHNDSAHKSWSKYATNMEIRNVNYYLSVCYLLRIQQYPVNTTYNKIKLFYSYSGFFEFWVFGWKG